MNWMMNSVYRDELHRVAESKLNRERLNDTYVLITGATGLIGSYLTDLLLLMSQEYCLGIQVYILVRDWKRAENRFRNWSEKDGFHILQGDVVEFGFCDDEVPAFDYIFHAAGYSHPRAFSESPVETMKIQLLGTMNLLEKLLNQKCKKQGKLLLFSTGEIYGDAPMESDVGWRETTIGSVDSMQTRACYPEGKRASETMCSSYFQEYGVQSVVARISYVFGAPIHHDNSRADSQFLRNAMCGDDIVMKSEGLQLRSYCYVADAVYAILLLMLEGKTGEAYNVATYDDVMTIRQFADEMAVAFNVTIHNEIPSDTEKKGYTLMKKSVLNPAKLYLLGFEPNYSVRDGMKQIREILSEEDWNSDL